MDNNENISVKREDVLKAYEEASAAYSGRQFADLWADFYLIRK